MTLPPTGPLALDADVLLDGRYRLLERIATGGMGEVWRAQDTVLGRPVAVKTLRAEHALDPDFRARLRAEARHAGGLHHPGIASVHDYGEQDGGAWLVMELVDGEPLSTLLHREGALTVDRTLDIVAQAALALEAAHEAGVVHRDVKPGNLLVRRDGVVKVTDFGIASAVDTAPRPAEGSVVGTAYYLSPEQAAGGATTPASDVYSLGVVAYECLTGRRPFTGDTAAEVTSAHLSQVPEPLPASVPAAVRALVEGAMDKDPARRPAHAGDLGRAAQQVRTSLTGATVPSAPATGHLHRRAVRLAGTTLVVVLAAAGVRSCAGSATHRADVPDVAAGTPVAAAEAAVRAARLTPRRRTATSATVPAGEVVATDPVAGTRVDEGAAVTLVVSAGPPRVSLPTYDGRQVGEVRAALLRLGLRPVLAYDGRGPRAGLVSAVTPQGPLTAGSAVVVHVVPRATPGSGR